MHILIAFLLLNLFFPQAFATESTALPNAVNIPTRIVVMPFKLVGNLDTKLDNEHKQRLIMANTALRKELQQTKRYDLVDETASEAFAQKVTTALSNNDCKGCESTLAKDLKAKQIVVPWVYRLSQLVLTMHFVILDVDTGKTTLKKALDFRGDNDKSWEKAIEYFVENVQKP